MGVPIPSLSFGRRGILFEVGAAPALGAPQIQQNRRILRCSHGWPTYPRFWDMWDSVSLGVLSFSPVCCEKDGTLKSPTAKCTRNLLWVSLCQTSWVALTYSRGGPHIPGFGRCGNQPHYVRVAHISLILGYVGICPHNVRLGETLCHARPHPKLLGDSATSHSVSVFLSCSCRRIHHVGCPILFADFGEKGGNAVRVHVSLILLGGPHIPGFGICGGIYPHNVRLFVTSGAPIRPAFARVGSATLQEHGFTGR